MKVPAPRVQSGGVNQISVTTYNGQNGFITNINAGFFGGSAPTLFAYAFDVSPTASNCVDKGTFTFGKADMPNLIFNPVSNSIGVAAGTNNGTTASFGETSFTPPRPFIAGGNSGSGTKNIWLMFTTATVITPSTTTDFIVNVGAALN